MLSKVQLGVAPNFNEFVISSFFFILFCCQSCCDHRTSNHLNIMQRHEQVWDYKRHTAFRLLAFC